MDDIGSDFGFPCGFQSLAGLVLFGGWVGGACVVLIRLVGPGCFTEGRFSHPGDFCSLGLLPHMGFGRGLFAWPLPSGVRVSGMCSWVQMLWVFLFAGVPRALLLRSWWDTSVQCGLCVRL